MGLIWYGTKELVELVLNHTVSKNTITCIGLPDFAFACWKKFIDLAFFCIASES
jgi:hypothetical protein